MVRTKDVDLKMGLLYDKCIAESQTYLIDNGMRAWVDYYLSRHKNDRKKLYHRLYHSKNIVDAFDSFWGEFIIK